MMKRGNFCIRECVSCPGDHLIHQSCTKNKETVAIVDADQANTL